MVSGGMDVMMLNYLKRTAFALLLLIAAPHLALAQFAAQQTWVTASNIGGTGNAITLTIPGTWALNQLVGIPIRFTVKNTNGPGGTTLSVNGTSATAVKTNSGTGLAALVGNEFIATNTAIVLYNGSVWTITSPRPAITPSSNTTQPFFATGSYTPNPGVSRVSVQLWAGGGGGFTVGAGGLGAGDGGGGGEYCQNVISIQPGVTITVTIGAGGTPDTSGANSSFGTYMTAHFGHGATGQNGAGPGAGGTGGLKGACVPGSMGNSGFTNGNHDILLGNGGAAFGTSISNPISNVSPHQANGNFPAGGGTGGNGGSGSNIAGTGASGWAIVTEQNN